MPSKISARSEQAPTNSTFIDFSLGSRQGQSDGASQTTVINDFFDAPAAACVTQARKLRALISCVSGGGFDNFNCLNEDIKEHVLWVMSDLCTEVVVLGELASEHATNVAQEARHG
jgi:hypothetical protein